MSAHDDAHPVILTVRDAQRRFGPDRPALSGADLDLRRGCVTALLGPSGSGKSTLLRAIAGLERLDGGEIRNATGEIWSGPGAHRPPEKRRVGMVFQDFALFPHLTALDNVAFGVAGPDRKQRAQAELDAAELGDRAGAYPHELSGGEQQRVALARALAPDPDVILLDEPFSGLDRRLRGETRERTVEALKASGAAALIVTHDPEEAMASADELALMSAGRVIQSGDPQSLYLAPADAVAARLLGDVNIHAGRVEKGVLSTPAGALASDLPDGAMAQALIRPQALELKADSDGPFTVEAVRSLGADAMVFLRLDDGTAWRARLAAPVTLKAGDRVAAQLNPIFASVTAGV